MAKASSPIAAIVGPTCVGKTAYVGELLKRFPVEVINLDSFQVFDHFFVGTGRADAAYGDRGHLYGMITPGEVLSPEDYATRATEAILAIRGHGNSPLFEGGSISYLRELMRREHIVPILVSPPDDAWLIAAIERRLDSYDPNKLFEEIETARARGLKASNILGDDVVYLPVRELLDGVIDLETARRRVVSNLLARAHTQLAAYEELGVSRVIAGTERSMDELAELVAPLVRP